MAQILLQLMLVSAVVSSTTLAYGTSDSNNCGWDSLMKPLKVDGESSTIEVSETSYGNNVSCETTVVYSGGESRHLRVEVEFFRLKGSSATGSVCLVESERLTIQLKTLSGKSVTWCGQLYAQDHVFPANKLIIIYNTGQLGQGKGFKLRISTVPVSSGKAGVLQADEKPRLLYSPGYPGFLDHFTSSSAFSVKLEGATDHALLIRVLMKDPGTDNGICSDYFEVDNEKYCGSLSDPKDILIQKNETEIRFQIQSGKVGGAFVLDYASYPSEHITDSSDASHRVGQVPKLFHIETSQQLKFVTEGKDEFLHLYFIGVEHNSVPVATLSDHGPYEPYTLDLKTVKHYWGKDGGVGIKMNEGASDLFVLIESVSGGHSLGSFRAEDTVAWLKRNCKCEDKRDFKLYLPEGSPGNIGVLFPDSIMEDSITVNNGPSTSYFDMVEGCYRGPYPQIRTQNLFVSKNTDVVTIELHPDQWSRGTVIHYFETDLETVHEIEQTGVYSLRLRNSDQKLSKNFFCSLIVRGRPVFNGVTSVKVKSNLDVPNGVITKKPSMGMGSVSYEVARLDADVREVSLLFQESVGLRMDFMIPDPTAISTQDPKLSLQVNDDEKFNNDLQDLYAWSSDAKEIFAPSSLSLGSLEIFLYRWRIKPEEENRRLLALTVIGVASPEDALKPESCAKLTLQSDIKSESISLNVCAGARGRHLYYYSHPVVVLLELKRWVNFQQPLFSYKLVNKDDVHPTAYVDFWCPSMVTLGVGQKFVFSPNGRIRSDRASICNLRILPETYDSGIGIYPSDMPNVGLGATYNITITGFDPSDPMETPLEVLVLNPRVDQRRLFWFSHMALRIEAEFSSNALFEYGIHMEKDRESNVLSASDEYQYIVSPNYPQPYNGGTHLTWFISANCRIQLELVEYRGSDNCLDGYLLIQYEPESYGPTSYKMCGGSTVLDITDNSEPDQIYKVVVEFYARDNQDKHKGFMLRYKTQQYHAIAGATGSRSNVTGVAVGATIASILLLLMVGAALAVFITHRRRLRHQQRQRTRRELLRNRLTPNSSDTDGDPGRRSNSTPSVFIVDSTVIDTNCAPPPYPGPPKSTRDSDNDNSSLGYYATPDGGFKFSPVRGKHTPSGAGSEYSNLELPPTYHPLMPGSPHNSEEHFYHSLSLTTRDSGISELGTSTTTLYSVAQSSNAEEEQATEAAAPYSLASHSNDAGYATPDSLSEDRPPPPPPYECANPLRAPPAYDVATSLAARSENMEEAGQDRG